MRRQPGFFDVDERVKELSAKGDALERLSRIADFELFQPDLTRAVPRLGRSKGDRRLDDLAALQAAASSSSWLLWLWLGFAGLKRCTSSRCDSPFNGRLSSQSMTRHSSDALDEAEALETQVPPVVGLVLPARLHKARQSFPQDRREHDSHHALSRLESGLASACSTRLATSMITYSTGGGQGTLLSSSIRAARTSMMNCSGGIVVPAAFCSRMRSAITADSLATSANLSGCSPVSVTSASPSRSSAR